MIFIIISLLHVCVYMYIVLIVSTLHRPPLEVYIYIYIYRRAGTERDFTDLNVAAAAADVRDQWAPRPQEPTLAASTDFNPYRLQRWRWPTAAQSSVTRQRTTAHHRPSTNASPSCQPHNISIDVLLHII